MSLRQHSDCRCLSHCRSMMLPHSHPAAADCAQCRCRITNNAAADAALSIACRTHCSPLMSLEVMTQIAKTTRTSQLMDVQSDKPTYLFFVIILVTKLFGYERHVTELMKKLSPARNIRINCRLPLPLPFLTTPPHYQNLCGLYS